MTMVMTMLSRRVAPVWSASLRYLPPLAPLTPLGPKLGSSRSLATSDHHEQHQATSSSLDFDKARKRVERLVSRYRRLVERANEGDNGDGTVHEEIGRLHPVVSRYERLEALRVERGSASGIAADPDEDDEMRALAREESESLGRKKFFLRCAPGPVGRRPPFSPQTCCRCINACRRGGGGGSRC